MRNSNSGIFSLSIGLLLLTTLFLSGCSNRFEDQTREMHQGVLSNLDYLKQQIDGKQLTNGLLIEKYAGVLLKQKPEYADVATLLKKEATSEGNGYQALLKRLAAINLAPTNEQAAAYGFQELKLINAAADSFEFNNSMADVVNTLAALSDGQLPVINVPASQRAAAQKSNALVGNPAYGNWQRSSNGQSFWAWYGMYSMFSNVFGGRSYYNSWSARPQYSYYGQYGRNRWGSSADVNRNYDLSRSNPTKYNRPSAATKTRYATTSRRASSYGGGTTKAGTKSSSAGTKSRYSSYGSSSRSSSFSSSRSFRSGK